MTILIFAGACLADESTGAYGPPPVADDLVLENYSDTTTLQPTVDVASVEPVDGVKLNDFESPKPEHGLTEASRGSDDKLFRLDSNASSVSFTDGLPQGKRKPVDEEFLTYRPDAIEESPSLGVQYRSFVVEFDQTGFSGGMFTTKISF